MKERERVRVWGGACRERVRERSGEEGMAPSCVNNCVDERVS